MAIIDILAMSLSAYFFILAAICNALMDTLQFHWYKFRWNNSVNTKYWNPAISWRNKYNNGNPIDGLRFKGMLGFMANFLDAWHLLKMIMIICFAFSVISFPYSFQFCIFNNNLLNGCLWLCILGIIWNIPFNLFYNKIFVKKNVISNKNKKNSFKKFFLHF